jgi:FKBP-type peptidyl-prolyl cis-trans isomerase
MSRVAMTRNAVRRLLLAVSATAALAATGCSKLTSPPSEQASPDPSASAGSTATAAAAGTAANAPAAAAAPAGSDKLVSVDEQVGTGAEAKTGDAVSVHYVGTLTNGTEFDSSRKRNQPFKFTLGQGKVIKGWDQGVVGMKVGGKRKLTIPPSLGYGARGAPPVIPPNSTLVFEIELVSIP